MLGFVHPILMASWGEAMPFGIFPHLDWTGVQRGFRGTAIQEVYDRRVLASLAAANKVPVSLPSPGDFGPHAGANHRRVWHPHGAGHLSGGPPRAGGRLAQDQLRHLPQRRL